MSVQNEGQRPGEFIVSLANHTQSMEEGLVNVGTSLLDGTPVVISGDYLVAATTTSVNGIIVGNHEPSTEDGPKKVAYVARSAEVKEALLNLPTNGTQNTNVRTGLAARDIILR